jgi:DNA helicase II / ATP-dependent DNA helicase PcrA
MNTLSPFTVSTMTDVNPSQQEAITTVHGPLLVLAGAGSGKTRVLTYKIAHTISQGVDPSRILAVTFTNKAAKEMGIRIEAILGKAQSSGLWIGTFHSICGRILRREIGKYQSSTGKTWSNNFVIYDETDSVAAIREAIKMLELDVKLYNPKSIKYQISSLKNQMINAHDFASSAVDFKAEKLSRIYDVYEAILSRNNALDFDDLLLRTVELLQQNGQVRDRYSQQFEHVLVDEFQDTNDTQYELVRLIVEGCTKAERVHLNYAQMWQHKSFTVVGDVDQSIYSWRGANFKIILNFQNDYPDAKLVKLEHNYRSSANILKTANAIIENNDERLPKTLISVKGDGEKVICYEAKDDRDEAFFIIEKFQDLTGRGTHRPGDCCVLYRTNSQSRVFEDILMSKGLSYTVIGGLKFYERREIKDTLAYLNLVFNDQDAYSVKRVINVPKRGIGNTSVEKLEAYAAQNGISLYEALRQVDQIATISPKTKKAVGSFVATIEDLKAQSTELSLNEFMVYVAEETGYLTELKAEDPLDSEGRVQNIEEFVSVAQHYLLDNPDGDLAGFLTQMSLLSDIDTAEPAENKYVLMTMHGAKGLEFPVVAIAGLEEGLFPHARSLSDREQMEEERRLMYVGVTRAETQLMLTYARRRMVFGELRYSSPSRFLKEAPQDLFTGMYSLDQEGGSGMSDSPYGSRKVFSQSRESGYSSSRFDDDEPVSRIQPKSSRSGTTSSSGTGGFKTPSHVRILEPGTRVGHAKFGEGTIEQVIGEGDKAVYSVKFDTIAGKKLLDPKFAKLEPM